MREQYKAEIMLFFCAYQPLISLAPSFSKKAGIFWWLGAFKRGSMVVDVMAKISFLCVVH
jgi:hypothetical protein